MNLCAESKGISAMRGCALLVASGVQAALCGQRQQRALGRVADQLAIANAASVHSAVGSSSGAQIRRRSIVLGADTRPALP